MVASKNLFSGHYFDGRSASKFPVAVRLTPQSLHLTVTGRNPRAWPYSEIRMSQIGSAGGPVRLEHRVTRYGEECVEAIVIDDASFLEHAHEVAPGALVSFWNNPGNRTWRRVALVLALLAVPPFLYALWTLGLPRLTDMVAERVPTEWERKLGDSVMESLIQPAPRRPEGEARKALEAIAARLLETVPGQPYEFRIYVHPSSMVNAMALPGGNIIVFQGLLNLTENPEELAGILAHEFQHVLLRHSTRGIIRQFATSVLLALVVGDSNTVMNTVLGAADQLETLSFNRQMESEADREGMRMLLAARVDPAGMVHIFEKFRDRDRDRDREKAGTENDETPEDDIPDWQKYLSTHPASQDRVVTLQKLSGSASKTFQPLLPGFSWASLHRETKGKGP